MNKPQTIVVSGSIAIDRIMSFSGRYKDYIHPENVDSLSISIFLDNLTDSYGGVGANICYSIAMLGDAPILLGSIGPNGKDYIDRLKRVGVNVGHVHKSKLPTASFNVITDGSENQVGGFYPGAMMDSGTLSFAPWKDDNPIAVVSPHDPVGMRRQVQECKQLNIRLFYDVGQQVSNLEASDLNVGVDVAEYLILNDYEILALAKKIGRSVSEIKNKVPVVVTTHGKEGSTIEGAKVKSPIAIGVVKPTAVADPTGAGDAYRAGFLYGLTRDWDLILCGQLGATTATYATEYQGTQGHRFDRSEVFERCEKAFGISLPQ